MTWLCGWLLDCSERAHDVARVAPEIDGGALLLAAVLVIGVVWIFSDDAHGVRRSPDISKKRSEQC